MFCKGTLFVPRTDSKKIGFQRRDPIFSLILYESVGGFWTKRDAEPSILYHELVQIQILEAWVLNELFGQNVFHFRFGENFAEHAAQADLLTRRDFA